MAPKIRNKNAFSLSVLIIIAIMSGCGDSDPVPESKGKSAVAITVGGRVVKVDQAVVKPIKKVQRMIRRSAASKSRGLLSPAQASGTDWIFEGGPEVPGIGVADDLAAIALPNRQVLVSGGFVPEGNESSNQAYLFDGDANTWEILPIMNAARRSHTMTSLQDGRVLIVGGFDESHIEMASAEIFDPLDRSFIPVAAPNEAYGFHMAVRLNDGQVLVAGGGLNNGLKAELYDPTTGQFSQVGDMLDDARVATLLPNGQVLLCGGFEVVTAQLFDLATRQFSQTSDMLWSQGVFPSITALADGRVLIAGGMDDNRRATNLTQIYDPASGQFVQGPLMADSRNDHIALLLPDNTVLVAGGSNAEGDLLATAELYDPQSNDFIELSSAMDGGRNDFAGAVLQP